ncbi:MAG: PDZ domain-containing protein [Thermomicrobiales bacterium]|nr:PDZ domain-containing protein [Thermomicrobiales bacterium]
MSNVAESPFSPGPDTQPDVAAPSRPALGYVRPRVTAGLVAGALGLGVVIGSGLPGGIAGTLAEDSLTGRPEFVTLERTWELIHTQWADPEDIDDAALIYGAARGMVDAVGDKGHSAFLDPTMVQEQAAGEAASYVGIGVEVDSRCGVPVVTSTFKGSPAREAGLQPGDVIEAVDGASTRQMDIEGLREAILGSEGDLLTVTVHRPGAPEPIDFSVERRSIDRDQVTWRWLPEQTVQLRITQFQPGVSKQVRSALQLARAEGAERLILDLRGNPGGLVSEVIGVASQLMDEGLTIFQEQGRDGVAHELKTIGFDGPGRDMALVVLIDGQSASGAEVLAAGLRDNGRAKLIGDTTFGTGTVLATFAQDDGSNVVLGTAFWLTPKGEHVWQEGVDPDEFVMMESDQFPSRPEDDPELSTVELAATSDIQLQAAFAAFDEADATQ